MSELPIVEELTRFDPATDFIPPDHIRRTAATLIRELVEALKDARDYVEPHAEADYAGTYGAMAKRNLAAIDSVLAKAKQPI